MTFDDIRTRHVPTRYDALVSLVRSATASDDCIVWPYARQRSNGYGRVAYDGRVRFAHRLAWEVATGRSADKLVCHTCDNPPCVNPYHLFLGDQRDNMLDALRKGRWRGGRVHGERHPHAKTTDSDVRLIRFWAAQGLSYQFIAAEVGLSHKHVGQIVRREIWRHVDG